MKKWILLFLLLPQLAWGATYYVCQTGTGSGDGSTYDNCESVANHNSDTFAADDIIYLCDTITSQVNLPSSGSALDHVITYRGDYADHAGIIDGGDAISIGLSLNQRDFITIQNLTIRDTTYIGIWSSDDSKQDGITIDGCSFLDLNTGIALHGDNCTVKNCTFGAAVGTAIELRDINNSHCQTFVIENNIFSGCGTATTGENGGILLDGDTNGDNADYHKGIIRYNFFENIIGRAIDGFFGESRIHTNVFKNIDDGAANSGIAIECNGPDNEIYNNTIYECQNTPIFMNEDPIDPNVASVVKNNIVYSATVNHIIMVSNLGGYEPTFDNNCYWMGTGGETKYYWKGTDYTFTNWKTASSQDANSMEANPLFVSAGTDFHIVAGSPSKNAGTSVGLTRDKDGIPIVGLPDIGAYEYFGVAAPAGLTIVGGSLQ